MPASSCERFVQFSSGLSWRRVTLKGPRTWGRLEGNSNLTSTESQSRTTGRWLSEHQHCVEHIPRPALSEQELRLQSNNSGAQLEEKNRGEAIPHDGDPLLLFSDSVRTLVLVSRLTFRCALRLRHGRCKEKWMQRLESGRRQRRSIRVTHCTWKKKFHASWT